MGVKISEAFAYREKKIEHTREQWIKWYGEKVKLMEAEYQEVTPVEFYRDLFPAGSFQTRGNFDDKGNGLIDILSCYCYADREKQYCKKYVLTDELGGLKYVLESNSKADSRLCLCSPVSYYGKHKTNKMAHELFAMVLDIDYVGISQLKNMMKQIGNGARTMPPNYIVNSGRGIHLYYLLKEPIPCYEYMVKQLTKFKAVMQDFVWNESTSLTPKKADHGACTQAFRMVGSETKLGKAYITRAYKVREERWTIEELYLWINQRASSFLKGVDMPKLREPIEVYRQKHPLTFEEAKKKYPNWIPSKSGKSERWICKKDLYNWWLEQIKQKAVVGGRYYAILALAAYGSKCKVPIKQVKKDALELLPYLESLTNDELNHFTKSDIEDALRFLRADKKNVTYKLTRARISELTKIDIPKNKRNGRKQVIHLKIARSIREIRQSIGENVSGGGRPDKQKIVEEWRKAHPDGKKIDCERETGLSRHTVLKWWE